MRLSRTIAYGLQAMVHLANAPPGAPVPCREVARQGGMPERFLLHVMRELVNHGLLCSTRGVDGGYYLSRPARQITLWDVVEAFDNPLDDTPPLDEGLDITTHVPLLNALARASGAARLELQRVTVEDLIAPPASVQVIITQPLQPPHFDSTSCPR